MEAKKYQWNPEQLSALRHEFERGFASIPEHVGKIILSRLGVEMPELLLVKPKAPAGQMTFEMSESGQEGSEFVYSFLRRPSDFGASIDASLSRRGGYLQTTLAVRSNLVEHAEGTAVTSLPLTAGYWVPSNITEMLPAHTGSGITSPLSHYMRMSLIACTHKADYHNTGSLTRKLTGANPKQAPLPSWLKN